MLNAEAGGYRAAALLDRMMCGQSRSRQRLLVEALHVVTRRSTDIVALDDAEVAAALHFIQDHASEPIAVSDIVEEVLISRGARVAVPEGHRPVHPRRDPPRPPGAPRAACWSRPNIPSPGSPRPPDSAAPATWRRRSVRRSGPLRPGIAGACGGRQPSCPDGGYIHY